MRESSTYCGSHQDLWEKWNRNFSPLRFHFLPIIFIFFSSLFVYWNCQSSRLQQIANFYFSRLTRPPHLLCQLIIIVVNYRLVHIARHRWRFHHLLTIATGDKDSETKFLFYFYFIFFFLRVALRLPSRTTTARLLFSPQTRKCCSCLWKKMSLSSQEQPVQTWWWEENVTLST